MVKVLSIDAQALSQSSKTRVGLLSPFRQICNVLYHHYMLSRMLLALW